LRATFRIPPLLGPRIYFDKARIQTQTRHQRGRTRIYYYYYYVIFVNKRSMERFILNCSSGRLAMPQYSAVTIYNQSNFSIAAIIVKIHEK